MRTFEQRVHDSNKGDMFSYDEVYRLKNVKFNSTEPTVPDTDQFEKQKTYQLDKVDNILKIVENQNDQTSEIITTIEDNNSKLNQYTTFDEWGLSYDQNGNTTQKGTQHFTYDYRNQMVTAQDLNATIDYRYDPFGRRAQKIISTNTTKYFYDGNQVIEERDTSNNVLKQYIYGNGIDEIIRVDNYESGTPVPYYYHTNAIGSVTAITDSSGNLVERITYDTFGMPTITDYQTDPQNPTIVNNSVIGNEYLFQGRRYDKETNLYYYRARYYDPIMRRFLQTDPMGYADTMNMYQGFNMNPLNFIDPLGKDYSCSTFTSYCEGKKYNPNGGIKKSLEYIMIALAYAINEGYKTVKDFENADWGHFTKQVGRDIGNLVTMGQLEKALQQEDLSALGKIFYFMDNFDPGGDLGKKIIADYNNVLEKSGSSFVALQYTLGMLIMGEELEGIFDKNTSIDQRIQAIGFFMSRMAAYAIGLSGNSSQADFRISTKKVQNIGKMKNHPKGSWILPEEGGGALIDGRWYTEHVLERMAPNTPRVMATLTKRALRRAKKAGLKYGTKKFKRWWENHGPNPRGIPTCVVEAEIINPGSTNVTVILNQFGDVVTVIKK